MATLNWAKRIKINNTGIIFSEDHYHFNALIHISTSSGNNTQDTTGVFDELTTYAERKKIAVTLDDEITQCYVEIQDWDIVAQEAWLWVRIPHIVGGDSTDLTLYLWYDSAETDNTTYIADLADTTKVFLPAGVFHLNDSDPSSNVDSSTFYQYDLTSYNITSGNIVAGKIGSFLDLNGSDEYMEKTFSDPIVYKAATTGVVTPVLPFTLECIVKTSNTTDTMHVVSVGDGSEFCSIGFIAGKAAIIIDNGSVHSQSSVATFADGADHHILGVFADVNDRRLYVDGNLVATISSTYSIGSSYDTMSIGRQAGASANYYDGIVGECRFHLSAGFEQLGSNSQNMYGTSTEGIIENSVVSPTGTLFSAIASSLGAEKSTDGGNTWASIGTLPTAITQGWSLCETPAGRILLGCYKSGSTGRVFYSDDVGVSWTATIPTTNDGIRSLVYASDGTVYATGPIISTNNAGIWESADNGVTWSLVRTHTNGDTSPSLFEASDGTIYAGFFDGKVDIKPSGGVWGAAGALAGATYVFDFIEINTDVYAITNDLTDSILYKTEDSGLTWSSINTITDFLGVKLHYDATFEVLYLLGGVRNDIFKSYDLGVTFTLANTTDVTSNMILHNFVKDTNNDLYVTRFKDLKALGKATWLHSDRLKTAEYAEASYLTCWDTLFDYGAEERFTARNDLDFLVYPKAANNLFFTLLSSLNNNLNFSITGVESTFTRLRFIIACIAELDNDLLFNVLGKTYNDLLLNILGKPVNNLDFLIYTDRIFGRRLSLFDTLNLRDTGVYSAPRNIVNLPIVYGDFSNSRIPCTPLDQDGYIYHISDGKIHSIVEVQVDGTPTTHGFTAYTSYQDPDEKGIACIVFDTPQYNAIISVSCRGRIKETDELIENPADVIDDLFLNVQGYDEDCIDRTGLDTFYSNCINEGVKVATYITSATPLRDFLDELSLNTHAAWLITDGKQRLRLKWLD